jgi:VWFA-related protein
MRKTYGICVALIAVLMLAGAVPTYAQGVVSLSVDALEYEDFPTAQVLVTVRNENGVPIAGLGPDKFEIVEDGRTSFPPLEVTAQVNPDAVVSVAMIIDISGSMEGKPIQEAMSAANALLEQLSPDDRAALIAFTDEVKDLDPKNLEEGKEIGFTTDKNAIRNVVNFLDEQVGWDTPLYDAIYKGVKMVATEPVGKRAVIVMTDGRDERDNDQGVTVKDAGSISSSDDPIFEANRHNIPIFSIGLEGLGGKIDTKYLTRLAERTGGQYQQTPQPEELTPLFGNVLSQLKEQYRLTYESTLPEDANYHSLLVRVQLPQGHAFGETKVRVLEEAPTAESSGSEPSSGGGTVAEAPAEEEAAVVEAAPEAAEPVIQDPAQEPSPGGIEGIIDTIQDVIQDQPLLAIVIGVGVLLLIILIIALLIVLLRGRKAPEDEYADIDYGDTYATGPGWTPEPAGPTSPQMPPPVDDQTEVAPAAWPEAVPPPPMPSPAPDVAQAEIPPVGGTRVIERAPKHLAMLVDKDRPDRKFDLKGTVNVGRAHDNQMVLEDPTVSRHHAWIKSEGEEFLVFDVGSGNGTFVNDERVEEPRQLENGDVVRFGEAAFVFTKVF